MLESLQTWWHRRAVMQDLRRVRRNEDELDKWQFKGAVEEARSAYARNDQRSLREFWDNILRRYRKFIPDSTDALDLQLDMGRFDEAEELFREAQSRRPREARYSIGLARVAQRRGDVDQAISRWNAFRKKFPLMVEGYSEGAASLAKAGRFADAGKVLQSAFGRLPGQWHLHMEYARLAEAQADWQTALTRWQALRDKWPDEATLANQFGTIGVFMCCRRLRRFDEAEGLFQKLRISAPLNPLPALEYAGIAEDQGDLAAAVGRWQQVLSRFPTWVPGYDGLIRALEKVGAEAEIDQVLADAVHRFPDEPSWLIRYAGHAGRRGDHAVAAERWEVMRRQFPQREEGYRYGADALAAAGNSAAAGALRDEHAARFTK
ncbi:MAG TPA: tetratricopeptide repeat protein [Acetobacteraceae bacterium]|nr:tetratricopeptide repeat protein [Acetobacteraceae bacterium]